MRSDDITVTLAMCLLILSDGSSLEKTIELNADRINGTDLSPCVGRAG